ncbi:MAG: hypothetical protein SO445_04020 [Lachnospiraceae bacterium]|nr:hypothetical protein [Lachnospiraceae bacterium]MDY4616862.1 hypothetical protein [Lachnospiraceae bacterium]
MLIAESTKEEREAYIREMFRCKNGDCENCGVCRIFAGTSPEEVYEDFVEGKREFSEIAREWNLRKQ